ncbi:MAG TPA: hypothetical protein VHF89_14125 [Solirubrobacteraceae bacterium]|nr:hypothetical protein [Solirubrobacteraceae bacterium]
MSPRLILELDRHEVAPGDEVTGTVVVAHGGRSRRLEVFLLLRERTAEFEHDALRIGSGPLAEGALEEGRSHRFSIRLPPDAPPQVATPNAEVYWEVDARSDQLGPDAHARQRIAVS